MHSSSDCSFMQEESVYCKYCKLSLILDSDKSTGLTKVDEKPILLNTPVIEQLFMTYGVQKLSQDAILTLNSLLSRSLS